MADGSAWRQRVLGLGGTTLPPNLALMVRLIGVVFLVHAAWHQLTGPFLPFGPSLDAASPATTRVWQLLGLALAALLALNIRVRWAALALGTLVLVQVAVSSAYYENNRTYAGLVLVMAGLSTDRRGRLVRLQVLLLYVAAALNKLLDTDWRSGRYMLQFSDVSGVLHAVVHDNPLLSPSQVSAFITWGAIVTELLLVVGFLRPRWFLPAIWVGVSYHTVLVLTTQRTFGMFWYLTALSYLAFVTWPGPGTVHYDPALRRHRVLRGLLDHLSPSPPPLTWTPHRGALALQSAKGSARGLRAALGAAVRVPAVPLLVVAVAALPDPRWDYAAAVGTLLVLLTVAALQLRSRSRVHGGIPGERVLVET